ncbi:beta-ketoacyl synthase [Streptomyces sp. AJS327]|uniref:beta-ketoacyl-[acyl-carrier-protein] synthase family protein n=1 Tax=Streptomyces sp. AJS327 TaxID=2545265 RepID=UPI0015DE1CEE|nr:beta-ketoacyl-[acyl-carrier-protein] synthase family protein [Streptomyces sp. AJS327]
MRRRVVVTGLGVVSALGTGTAEFWPAVREGRVGTGEVSLFDTADCLTHRGGEIAGWIPGEEPGTGPLTRSESFALSAVRMALRDGGLLDADDRRLPGGYPAERIGAAFGIVVGNRPGLEGPLARLHAGEVPALPPVTAHDPFRVSGLPAERFGLHGPHLLLPTACAAGNGSVAHAAEAVAEGRADAMVAGGADELSESMFLMFNSFRALAPQAVRPFDAHRIGMMLGEGSGVLLLESEEGARRRGAVPYAVVAGHGAYSDAHHMTAPHPAGLGAVRSLRAALDAAGLGPDDVDLVSAHGTGTPANDAAEARALTEVFGGRAAPLPVTALKSLLGHAQGAAGAIASVACALAVRDGVVWPTANVDTPDPACLAEPLDLVRKTARDTPVRAAVNNAFGFGGNNCCLVFTAPEASR